MLLENICFPKAQMHMIKLQTLCVADIVQTVFHIFAIVVEFVA